MSTANANQELLEAIKSLAVALKQGDAVTSPATEVILSIVPIAGIVFGCVLMFFYFLWQYRLKKELIKANQYEKTNYRNLRTWTLLMGCLSTVIGLPMTILFLVVGGASHSVLGGLIPFSAGIGFLLFYALSKGKE